MKYKKQLHIKKKAQILAFIPARKGSSRIKNKNIILFNKKPLIYYSIYSAIKSKYITDTVVYSNSDKIKILSKKFGANTNFNRPHNVSRNNTTMYQTIKYFLKKNLRFKNFDYLLLLQPTSPLRSYIDINKSIRKLFKNSKADGIISTFRVKKLKSVYPEKFMIENNGYLRVIKKNKIKSYKNLYLRNGPAIFLIKIKSLKAKMYNIKLLNYVMSEKKSLDINNVHDLKNFNYRL